MASLTFADSTSGDIVVEESDNLNETVIVDTDGNEIEGEDKEVVNSDNNLETGGASNGEGVGSIGDLVGQSSDADEEEFFDAPSSLSEQTGIEVEWEVRYDPVHEHPYWINVKTGESSWENPNGADGTEAVTTGVDQITHANEAYEYTEQDTLGEIEAKETNTTLGDDTWERHYDPESDWYYYYNPTTGETKWDNITEEYGTDEYQYGNEQQYGDENSNVGLENTVAQGNSNEEGAVEGTTISNSALSNAANETGVQASVARAWLKEARKIQAIGAK
eukprot:g7609.t1